MAANVDFADNFWGDKHMGFSVLYQHMKAGQLAVKELSDFLKERIQLEEDYSKAISKNFNKVNHYAQSGHNFTFAWTLAKNTLERVGQAQTRLVHNLHELSKEVHKYGDELQKNHRKLKEQETFDAVNLMQTTTTCLQKAKETYTSRCVELKKLKLDGGSDKEIGKAETKAGKARDEYKQYVEKYGRVRDDFERKLVNSARTFQKEEQNYLRTMKTLLATFARHTEDCHAVSSQVCGQLRETMDNLDTNEILTQFIENKSTGSERPCVIVFEEPEIDSLLPPSTAHDSTQNHRPSPPAELELNVKAEPQINDLIKLSPMGDKMMLPPSEPPPPIPVETTPEEAPPPPPPAPAISGSHSRTKLTLLLPGRKKHSASTDKSTPADTTPTGSVASEGFLKKRAKKDKKRRSKEVPAEVKSSEHGSVEETRSSASSRSDDKSRDGALVDEEGFSIKPADDPRKPPKWDSRSSSSFDSDDEDEQTKKIKRLAIKPTNSSPLKAPSVDELKDAVGSITIGRAQGTSMFKSKTFDSDPWPPGAMTVGRGPGLLKPSLTGDDRLNRTCSGFAGEWSSVGQSNTLLAPSLTGSSTRARPRSNTPTAMFNITASQMGRKDSDSDALSRADSMGSLSGDSVFGAPRLSASSSFSSGDVVPIAMAVTETVHAWFQGSQSSKVRVMGSVHVSFPLSALSLLLDEQEPPPLSFRLTKAERLNALIPNKQVLSADAVSNFSSSESHSFSFDHNSLVSCLQKQREQRPNAQFFNIELLRYEVRNPQAPLLMLSFWKCEAQQTDFRLDYRLNPDCGLESALLNLQFTTGINGDVQNVTAKPDAQWSRPEEQLVWRLTELSRHGEGSGSLKARVSVSRGPSQPSATRVQFSSSDATFSGAQVELDSENYRLSLLRRKVVSGKYICDAENR